MRAWAVLCAGLLAERDAVAVGADGSLHQFRGTAQMTTEPRLEEPTRTREAPALSLADAEPAIADAEADAAAGPPAPADAGADDVDADAAEAAAKEKEATAPADDADADADDADAAEDEADAAKKAEADAAKAKEAEAAAEAADDADEEEQEDADAAAAKEEEAQAAAKAEEEAEGGAGPHTSPADDEADAADADTASAKSLEDEAQAASDKSAADAEAAEADADAGPPAPPAVEPPAEPDKGEDEPATSDSDKRAEKGPDKGDKAVAKPKTGSGGPPPDAFKSAETRFDKYITTHACFVLMCVTFVLAVVFEVAHYGIIKSEYAAGEPLASEEQDGGSWADYRNFNLVVEYFFFTEVGRSRGLPIAGMSLGIGGLGLFFAYAINSLVANYWDGLQEQNWNKFFMAIMTFVSISVCSLVGNAYREYIDRIVFIQARQWLTEKYTRQWLGDSAHFQPGVADAQGVGGLIGKTLDNPDQRICSDCARYVSTTLSMIQDFATNLGMLLIFLPILWKASPSSGPFGFKNYAVGGWLCYAALAYASFGTLAVHLLANRVSTLSYAKERAEADLRFGLVTVRDHSEGVAMLAPQSEEREKSILQRLYNEMRGLQWRLSFLSKRLNIFQSMFWDISDIGPIFILAPAFFSGELTMGTMLSVRHALDQVTGSFAWFVAAYYELATWGAVCHRLREVDKFSAARAHQLQARVQQGAGLQADELTLHTPLGEALLDRASFAVPRGKWALLSGPEGSGKTTLLRALRGVGLPPVTGSVGLDKVQAMFVPAARNTGLRDGSLYAAVTYPQRPQADLPAADAVAKALHAVGLGELLERGDGEAVGLEAEADWGRLLSAGELQRLLLAKAVLAAPDVLVLDEPVAHCAEGEATHLLFKRLKEALPQHTTVLTVTHQGKEVLREFHDLELSLDPKGRMIHCQPVV